MSEVLFFPTNVSRMKIIGTNTIVTQVYFTIILSELVSRGKNIYLITGEGFFKE